VSLQTALCKAIEELGEVAEAINKKRYEDVGPELADVSFCLMNIARGLGTDLLAEMAGKLPEIEKRLEGKK
jgi:NTP pyrophosphatase (non-canonical NTP hydrolase)